MRLLLSCIIACFSFSAFALQKAENMELARPKYNGTPCVQAFLNKDVLNSGTYIAKNTKGIITVTKNNKTKVFFNITLKSNIGKKGEPPIYLRFIKQKQLNIAELLEYASEGDEILIEEFVPTADKADPNCIPSSITVVENL
ncbi:MAG: hypothetical protein R2807_08250 [Chitinophagales bacterium]